MPDRLGPEHWLKRAQEAAELAETMSDAAAKAAMLEVARQYGFLAATAATIREEKARLQRRAG